MASVTPSFSCADGRQLRDIATLVEANIIRPVVDKVFAFEKTPEALEYVESARAFREMVLVKDIAFSSDVLAIRDTNRGNPKP